MDDNSIVKQKNQLTNIFKGVHKQFNDDRTAYYGKWHPLRQDIRNKGFHEVIPITHRQNVDILAGHFRPDDFSVTVNPLVKGGRDPSKKAQAQADGIEEHVRYMFENYGLTSGESPFNAVGKTVWLHGVAILKGLYDWKAWGIRPTRKEGQSKADFEYEELMWEMQRGMKIPYILKAVDPTNALWWPLKDFTKFVEVKHVYNCDIKDDYPKYDYAEGGDFVARPCIEWWDEEGKYYLVDTKSVPMSGEMANSNPYGFIPYTLIWSGLGREDPLGKIERQFCGVIHPLKALVEEQARRLTALSILIQVASLGRGYTRGLPDGVELTGVPGEMKEIGNAEIGYLDMPNAPKDLYNLITMVTNEIDDYIGVRQLGGQKIPGISAAVGYELLREESKKRYQSFLDSFEAGLSRLASQYLNILENHIEEPIPGVAMKPSDIKGYYKCEVRLKFKDVAHDRMIAALARLLYNAGLYDLETLHGPEFLNSPDFNKIQEGIYRDRLLQQPEIVEEDVLWLQAQLKNDDLINKANARAKENRKINVSPTPEVATRATEDEFAKQLYGDMGTGVGVPGIEEM